MWAAIEKRHIVVCRNAGRHAGNRVDTRRLWHIRCSLVARGRARRSSAYSRSKIWPRRLQRLCVGLQSRKLRWIERQKTTWRTIYRTLADIPCRPGFVCTTSVRYNRSSALQVYSRCAVDRLQAPSRSADGRHSAADVEFCIWRLPIDLTAVSIIWIWYHLATSQVGLNVKSFF